MCGRDRYDFQISWFVVAVAVVVPGLAGAGCAGYAEIVEDIADDAGSRPIHDYQRKHLDFLEKNGYTETKKDYNKFIELGDKYNERTNEKGIEDLKSCMIDYVDALQTLQDWKKDDMPGHLKACSKSVSCGGAKEDGSGEVQKLGAKYYNECVARQEKFMRGLYRESLAGLSKGVRETEWPLRADQYMTKLKVLRDDATEDYGEDDKLVEDYNARIEELESGETGEKLARYREFEQRQTSILERMSAQRQEVLELKNKLQMAAEEFEYARTRAERAKADRKHEAIQVKLHEAEKKYEQIKNQFEQRAAEADITSETDSYEATLGVYPGDTDGWGEEEDGDEAVD
jgi:hypothetical protein